MYVFSLYLVLVSEEDLEQRLTPMGMVCLSTRTVIVQKQEKEP